MDQEQLIRQIMAEVMKRGFPTAMNTASTTREWMARLRIM